MATPSANNYERFVLGHPKTVLSLLAAILLFFTWHAQYFQLDASADSLLLEDDRDLKIFREMSARYGISEFLVLTYTPHQDLFTPESLNNLRTLRNRLQSLDRVESVVSILEIPLIESSGLKLSEITAEGIKTLDDDGVNVQLAKKEMLSSPIYRNYVLSEGGQTTGMMINLKADKQFSQRTAQRNKLLALKHNGGLNPALEAELAECQADYDRRYEISKKLRHQDIITIRSLIEPFKQDAVIYLGGVPMIADDMITFIKKDLIIFGFGVFIFIIITLTFIFRDARWVVLPLLSCFFAVIVMIGVLGFCNWKVTVISSNFISLMLILTMSMNIHLAVRYRQLCQKMQSSTQLKIVSTMVQRMVWPCLYTAMTTILAFFSLLFSGIRPVIDFGWMMTIGLSVTFLTSFLLFPSLLMLLKKSKPTRAVARRSAFTGMLAVIAEKHGRPVLLFSMLLALVCIFGITRLKVENSFIQYFSDKTEIYQGLKLIDDKLGGTMLLDIVISFQDTLAAEEDEFDEDFDDDFGFQNAEDPGSYWFTPHKIELIKKAHDYLDGLPEVGKVLSLASAIRTVERLNNGKVLDSIEMGVMYKKIPAGIKKDILDPYVSIKHNEARISLRVLDSLKDLRRKELLERISHDLESTIGLKKESFTIAGLLVLYNNMLQSLFKSQIMTLGIVILGIGLMLLILFRSLPLAVIGIVPNLLSVCIVLGIMGLLGIPLDMMTITIAAITMGIAIDNSIHYMYRFKEEYQSNKSYERTLHLCHQTIGKAVMNTSVTIIFGFSILVLSNFIPTIYFGIFTGLAMFIALLSVLTLLPQLIILFKPFTIKENQV